MVITRLIACALRNLADRIDPPKLSEFQGASLSIRDADPVRVAEAVERLAVTRRASGFGR